MTTKTLVEGLLNIKRIDVEKVEAINAVGLLAGKRERTTEEGRRALSLACISHLFIGQMLALLLFLPLKTL